MKKLMRTCFFVFGVALLSMGSLGFAEESQSPNCGSFELSDGRQIIAKVPFVDETWREGMLRWCNENGQGWLKGFELKQPDWNVLRLGMLWGWIERDDPRHAVLEAAIEQRFSGLSPAGRKAWGWTIEKILERELSWEAVNKLGVGVDTDQPCTLFYLEPKRYDQSIYEE